MKSMITAILAAAIGALGMTAAQAQPNPPGVNPEHYACYQMSPAKSFRLRQVGLVDQFGKGVAAVIKEVFLCAPVSKNEQPIKDEKTHLLCYTLRTTKTASKAVIVTNQFGESLMKVGRLVQLCVPSLKRMQ